MVALSCPTPYSFIYKGRDSLLISTGLAVLTGARDTIIDKLAMKGKLCRDQCCPRSTSAVTSPPAELGVLHIIATQSPRAIHLTVHLTLYY